LRSKRERLETAIKNLRSGSMITDMEYLRLQVGKNEEEISSIDSKIEILTEKIESIENGELDDELKTDVENNMSQVRKKNEITRKKMEATEKHLKVQKQKSEAFFKKQYQPDRLRASEYEMNRAYDRFVTISNDIPKYMLDNLKNMPNNKAYLWKGVYFFGALPREPNAPRVVFEKQRGDVMLIHETIGLERHTYRKVGKEPKEYVSTTVRPTRK
jgi:hypothetical protein